MKYYKLVLTLAVVVVFSSLFFYTVAKPAQAVETIVSYGLFGEPGDQAAQRNRESAAAKPVLADRSIQVT